jgi:hypothetical protein
MEVWICKGFRLPQKHDHPHARSRVIDDYRTILSRFDPNVPVAV